MRLGFLAMLSSLLAVGHYNGEPVEQAITDGGQLLWLAFGRFGGEETCAGAYRKGMRLSD